MKFKLPQIIFKYKALLISSTILSILLGIGAANYPISYIGHLSISNNENSFSLSELKRVKNKFPLEAQALVANESDPGLKKLLENLISDTNWIDKSIRPILAMTKTDVKDALQGQNEKLDVYHIDWLNIETAAKDEELAGKLAIWIAEVICKINYKESLSDYIQSVRDSSGAALVGTYNQIAQIEILIEQMQKNIKIIRQINLRYPETISGNSKLQLNLSTGENKENLNSLSYLSAYLPPLKQLAVIETQLAQSLEAQKILDLEREVHLSKYDAAKSQLEALANKPLDQLFSKKNIIYKFWPYINFADMDSTDAPQWKKNYLSSYRNSIRVQEQTLSTKFDHQLSEINTIKVVKKYQQNILTLYAIVFGLVAPTIICLMPIIVKKIIGATTEA